MKCDYQTNNCTGAPAVSFLEYEADVDADYSHEYNGDLYPWWGFICQECLQAALKLLFSCTLHRWRCVPADKVDVVPVGNDWHDNKPDWTNASVQWKGLEDPQWADARLWKGPMPKSALLGGESNGATN